MIINALRIDRERLMGRIAELAQVGGYVDERTKLAGVNRLALTDADAAARRLVMSWFQAAGLSVKVDRIGNVLGRRAGQSDVPPVMSGSHIDSVPTGGAYDGVLGVLAALEVVETLNDHSVVTERPIEIGFFTDEEGARFGTDMLGSAVACGRISLENAWSLTDSTGVSVRQELERIGFLGEHGERVSPPHAFVEVHVEQGPVLSSKNLEVGVVTGVQAISWHELRLSGKSCHAGTTPMGLRKDPLLVASLIAARMHEMATSGEYGEHMRATMGRMVVHPNRVNVVASEVVCTVDLRNPSDEAMARAESDLREFWQKTADEQHVVLQARQTAKTSSVTFDHTVQKQIEDQMKNLGVSYEPLLSGAGHDCQEFAAICPAAMIFVRGEYDGISHNPREYSTPEVCEHGANILLHTIASLAGAAGDAST